MGNKNPSITDLRTLVIGCTPLARKVINLLKEISNLVGVVNLHPEVGVQKSNYDQLADSDPFWTKDINDKQTEAWIRSREPDLIIQCGWSQIFKSHILDIPSKYCIGIHPSPLPIGRGAAVINWKIIESNGKAVHWGNSLFQMVPKTDMGPILDFEPFIIEPCDDVRTAYSKVDSTALKMIQRVIPQIHDGSLIPTEQDNESASRYYKRTPKDGEVSFLWNSTRICDYVRALTHPYPGAFVQSKMGKLLLWKAVTGPRRKERPGQVCEIKLDHGILIACGDGCSFWLRRLSHENNEWWADEWAVLNNISVGDSLIE